MTTTLIVAVGLAVADLALVAICVRRRAVLGGLAGIAALGLVAFAALQPAGGMGADSAWGLAVALVLIGAALVVIGHVVERLLDDVS